MLFFFLKTNQIKKLSVVQFVESIKQFLSFTTTTKPDITNFWKKFQKLKRPKTQLDINSYYLDVFKSKLDKYNKAGFLILFNSFYLVRSKSELLLNTYLKVNKQLLVSPKYSSSTINKYLSLSNLQNFEFQFLRKNKVYNKGRYSRCRQNYRTGVYMCMYLSIVSIFGLYY